MPAADLIILTDRRFVPLKPDDAYHRILQMEEGSLMEALQAHGWKVERRSWDDPHADWARTRALLFRSTWDYMDRFPEFRAWLEKAASLTSLINPHALVQWNLDKHYLDDLARKGIPIPPTRFIAAGQAGSLSEHLRECAWDEVILKPVISAGARHTYHFPREEAERHEEIFRKLIARESMMLQEFQQGIARQGEVSLVFLGGRYSHAVLKQAAAGEFRVQDDFGGSVAVHQALDDEVHLGLRALALCQPAPLYARVDLVRSSGGEPLLMELELIEPELWFRLHPEAAVRMAEIISLHLRHD